MTLSQVALGTAMIFGILALITLAYRVLTHPMYMVGRSEAANVTSTPMSRSLFSRASLSSMQRAIVWRLRDRPPQYGTNSLTSNERTEAPELPSGEPPPLYEGTQNDDASTTGTEVPPAYSVAIISSPHLETVDNTNVNQTLTVLTALVRGEEIKKDLKKNEVVASRSS